MDFIKRLFGAAGQALPKGDNDPNALFLYVKIRKCGAIARVRVDMRNDLSLDDDGENYVVRKQAVDNVCYGMADVELRFDNNRHEISRNAENGEFVNREAWDLQESQRISPKESRKS
jgi:hypothetical protein